MQREAKLTISTFGAILGMAGLEHGIGEVLQGNTTPSGIMIESWPNVEAYEILAGEPAMTIIPNLLLSGILSVVVALIMMAWAIRGVGQKHSGTVLILLSLILLCVGGGFGPPIIGVIVGLFSVWVNRKSEWIASERPFGRIWPYMLVSGVLGYLSLWPGLVIFSVFVEVEAFIVIILALFSFSTLVLSLLSSSSYVKKSQGVL
ncbi:MAG: hypothetical protein ACFFED_18735 [Candidatus Thorarchaeota archaeon]